MPLAKINFSNIFVCLVCSTMFYKCFIEEQHYICRDAIGYVFFLKKISYVIFFYLMSKFFY
jgi:hypothetical protein